MNKSDEQLIAKNTYENSVRELSQFESDDLSSKDNQSKSSTESQKSLNIEIQSLELGDVILLHAHRNTNVDQNTYYVYYIDSLKLKLLNTYSYFLFY